MSPGILGAVSLMLAGAGPALAADADPRNPDRALPTRTETLGPDEASSAAALEPEGLAPPLALRPAPGAMELAPGLCGVLRQGHDHGPGDDGSHHGAWMGTTMLVVMVVMMATVGVVMMTRAERLASVPSGGPAVLALPRPDSAAAPPPRR